MTYHHNQKADARDDLLALREKIWERQREYLADLQPVQANQVVLSRSAQAASHPSKKTTGPSANHLYFDLSAHHSPFFDPSSIRTPIEEGTHPTYVRNQLAHFRVDVAKSLGVNPTELSWTHSATDAMTACFRYIDWQSHDFCLTTNMEHSGGMGPLHASINHSGIRALDYGKVVRIHPISGELKSDGVLAIENEGNVLSLPTGIATSEKDAIGYPIYPKLSTQSYDQTFFDQRLKPALDGIVARETAKLKLVFFSSPSFITGLRLPEKQIAQWTWQQRAYSFLDGAQLSGMSAIDLHEMGVDFFAASGHKWLGGPTQTGIAYLRRGNIHSPTQRQLMLPDNKIIDYHNSPYSNPTPLPRFWPPHGQLFQEPKDLDIDPADSLLGTPNPDYSLIRALYERCELWAAIGRPLLEEYVVLLAQYLRWRLSELRPIEGLYGEFRQAASTDWKEVWHPSTHGTHFPTHIRSGLTAWAPFSMGVDQRTDSNQALSEAQALQQMKQAQQILSRLASRFGIHTRTTRCPHQLRTEMGHFSANRFPELGPITASTPLRFTTHFFHTVEDIDYLVETLNHPDIAELYSIP